MGAEELVLRWSEFNPCISGLLASLLHSEDFADVTLAAEGTNIKCHKLVLSACSPYFQNLFRDHPCQHPVVILKDVKYNNLRAVVEYMYNGEVKVMREDLSGVMKAGEILQVRGLTGEKVKEPVKGTQNSEENHQSSIVAEDLSRLPCKKRRLTDSSDPNATFPSTNSRESLAPSSGGLMPSSASLVASSGSLDVSRVGRGSVSPADMSDIRPDILEMIKEEQKAKMAEMSQGWMGASSPSPSSGCSAAYQNQMQSMWQKCWNQNNSVFQGLRYRERGPMKSWRPETMAEAIWSVLNEGLSLSQAARKHDIPYPTFVLYANRVHNLLGPSVINGLLGTDLRPKGRGRPQRILLGQWPEDHVRQVIRSVVFRDGGLATQTPPPPSLSTTETPPPSSVHPTASEARAAQAAFESHMKSLYSNPFASQLLAASSKVYSHLEEGRFFNSIVKEEAPDPSYEDAEEESEKSSLPNTEGADNNQNTDCGDDHRENPRKGETKIMGNKDGGPDQNGGEGHHVPHAD